MSTFSKNTSEYEGQLLKNVKEFNILIEELLSIINRHGIDLENEEEVQNLLIKTGIQLPHER